MAHATSHDHPAHLQHHFVSSDQQFDSAKMGLWLFLITEVLLFSGMFVAYAVYRSWYPEEFTATCHTLAVWAGTLNTVVLLTSSFTMVLAINAIQNGDQKRMIRYLLITVACGLIFMCVKAIEYYSKYKGGVFFGMWNPTGEHYEVLNHVPHARQFMNIYLVMTGIHGSHVLIGMGLLLWCVWQGKKGTFSAEYYTHVENAGLFWHLVDIIWIFLFPLLYLCTN
jgi:cytochrome c oxidase subunit III